MTGQAKATSRGASGATTTSPRMPRAREVWFARSLELHRAAGHRTMEAWSLHMLALSEVGQRRFDEALETARHAMRHFHEVGDVSGVTLVLDDLAIIALALGDTTRAGRLWGAARHLQQTTRSRAGRLRPTELGAVRDPDAGGCRCHRTTSARSPTKGPRSASTSSWRTRSATPSRRRALDGSAPTGRWARLTVR